MHSFELKTVIAAPAPAVYAALTDPQYVVEWDYCRWMQNDLRRGGTVRKRDAEGRLFEGEIVAAAPPFHFTILCPVLVDDEDEDEGRFVTRREYAIEAHDDKSVLHIRWHGFPTAELAAREQNSWGGYFLEKIKEVAERRHG